MEAAKGHLTFISYYRFCQYGLEFEEMGNVDQKYYKPKETSAHIIADFIIEILL